MRYKASIFLILVLVVSGCGTSENGTRSAPQFSTALQGPLNSFTVPGQLVLSDLVHSIHLSRTGSQNSAPIIRLKSNDTLSLNFDLLQFDSRSLRVSFTHHDPDWSRSNLVQEFYQEGLFNLYLDTGTVSTSQRPTFRSYQYEFPNRDVKFLVSGNYMVRVEDADTGNLLFAMPFFVAENEGDIVSRVETVLSSRAEVRYAHFPRSLFELPDFVEMPQFNLEFYYVQNQFWGRKQLAGELDTSTEGEVLFEMERQRPFDGDYEFQFLSLNNLSLSAPQISEFDPTTIPPRVVLFDDAQGFAASRTRISGSRFGKPNPSRSAQYADVHFRLEPEDEYPEDAAIYLVGDFNNWAIQSNYAMEYDSDIDRWKTNGIIKEGSYSYKYVLIEDNRVNDLALDDSFTRVEQEYHAFVYYRDPDRNYYRLLQTNNFFARS